MTKKKQKQESKNIYIIYLCLILLVLVICTFIIPYHLSFEPKITIYKEECVNGTIEIGEKLIKKELVNRKTIKLYNNYGELCLEKCYEDTVYKFEYPCNEIFCKYLETEHENVQTYCPKFINIEENQTILIEDWEIIYETKEICELVEVDEIKIFDGYSWDCSDYSVEQWKSCSDPCFHGTSYQKDYDKCINNCEKPICEKISKIIQKQDITIDWLNENAKCIDCYPTMALCEYPEKGGCEDEVKCKIKDFHCTKYQIENYIIKVK